MFLAKDLFHIQNAGSLSKFMLYHESSPDKFPLKNCILLPFNNAAEIGEE